MTKKELLVLPVSMQRGRANGAAAPGIQRVTNAVTVCFFVL